LDPNGKNYDDFYFTQTGELIAYVDNKDPNKVFVAKDDKQVYDNLKNATDQDMYDKVEMSDKEVQQKMKDNGYKKVAGRILREELTSTVSADQPGNRLNSSSSSITEVVEDYKYTKTSNINIDSKIIGDPLKSNTGDHYYSEYVTRRELIYGKKSSGQKVVDILVKINNVRSGSYTIKPISPCLRYPNYASLPNTKKYLKEYK